MTGDGKLFENLVPDSPRYFVNVLTDLLGLLIAALLGFECDSVQQLVPLPGENVYS